MYYIESSTIKLFSLFVITHGNSKWLGAADKYMILLKTNYYNKIDRYQFFYFVMIYIFGKSDILLHNLYIIEHFISKSYFCMCILEYIVRYGKLIYFCQSYFDFIGQLHFYAYEDFVFNLDWTIWALFGKHVEYFRFFKYNEYINLQATVAKSWGFKRLFRQHLVGDRLLFNYYFKTLLFDNLFIYSRYDMWRVGVNLTKNLSPVYLLNDNNNRMLLQGMWPLASIFIWFFRYFFDIFVFKEYYKYFFIIPLRYQRFRFVGLVQIYMLFRTMAVTVDFKYSSPQLLIEDCYSYRGSIWAVCDLLRYQNSMLLCRFANYFFLEFAIKRITKTLLEFNFHQRPKVVTYYYWILWIFFIDLVEFPIMDVSVSDVHTSLFQQPKGLFLNNMDGFCYSLLKPSELLVLYYYYYYDYLYSQVLLRNLYDINSKFYFFRIFMKDFFIKFFSGKLIYVDFCMFEELKYLQEKYFIYNFINQYKFVKMERFMLDNKGVYSSGGWLFASPVSKELKDVLKHTIIRY